MRSRILRSVLLLGVLNLEVVANAQMFRQVHLTSTDVAVTYNTSFAKPVGSSSTGWIPGGGVDAGFTLYRGWGVAGSFAGEHTSDIVPSVGVTELSYMGGPRYTYVLKDKEEKQRTSIFGECLFGETHAYDGVFPGASGAKSSANDFTMETGGGLNMEVGKGFGLRLPEVHYVRTTLPNGANNTQNDIRLAIGVSYHIRKH